MFFGGNQIQIDFLQRSRMWIKQDPDLPSPYPSPLGRRVGDEGKFSTLINPYSLNISSSGIIE